MPLDEVLRKATGVGRKCWDVLHWEVGKDGRALQPDKPPQSHSLLSTTSALTEPETLKI